MVTKRQADNQVLYRCDACYFRYKSRAHAAACEVACTKRGICDSEIAKHAYDREDDPSEGEQSAA